VSGSVALFVGDISVDLTMTIGHVPAPDEKVHAASVSESPGGVVANAAVASARAGGSSRLLVQIGSDSAGRTATEGVRRAGVDVVAETVDGVTCRVVILVEPHGEKRLLLYPGVSMYASRRQVAKEGFAGIGWVHTAVYDTDASVELAARCRADGVPLSLDLEPATFPSSIDDLAAVISDAEVIFCNRRSTARLGAGAVERLFAMGARAVVLTLGSEGAILVERGGNRVAVPAPSLPIRDTSGAGDCLAGWFVAERLRNALAPLALQRAVFAATVSCGRLGTQSSFPTRDEVAALLRKPA
jgi:ribokinase